MKTHHKTDHSKKHVAVMVEQDWRRLASQVITETDPKRLMDLLDRLIRELDERREAMRSAPLALPGMSEPGDTRD